MDGMKPKRSNAREDAHGPWIKRRSALSVNCSTQLRTVAVAHEISLAPGLYGRSDMTSTWDVLQEFLGLVRHIKDPELYGTVCDLLVRVFGDIHDIDHRLDEKLSKQLYEARSFKTLRELTAQMRDAKKRVDLINEKDIGSESGG